MSIEKFYPSLRVVQKNKIKFSHKLLQAPSIDDILPPKDAPDSESVTFFVNLLSFSPFFCVDVQFHQLFNILSATLPANPFSKLLTLSSVIITDSFAKRPLHSG